MHMRPRFFIILLLCSTLLMATACRKTRRGRLPSWSTSVRDAFLAGMPRTVLEDARVDHRSISSLVKGLEHSQGYVKIASALVLSRTQAAPAVPKLLNLFLDVWDIRMFAKLALLDMGAPAIPGLRRATRNKRWIVRRTAAEVLGAMGPMAIAARGDLVALLGDPKWGVVQAAATALGQIGATSPRPDTYRAFFPLQHRKQIVDYIGRYEKALYGGFTDRLKWNYSFSHLYMGARIRKFRMAHTYLKVYTAWRSRVEMEPRWQKKVADRRQFGPVVDKLVKVVADDDFKPHVRAAAATAMARLAVRRSTVRGALTGVLDEKEPKLREAVLGALGATAIVDAGLVDLMLSMLRHPTEGIRSAAAGALGAMGPAARKAVGPLGVASKDPAVRISAVLALTQIAPGATATRDAAARLLSDSHHIFVQLGLIVLLRYAETPASVMPEEIVNEVVQIIGEGKRSSRLAAIAMVGHLGPRAKQALPALRATLKESNDEEMFQAAMAAIRIAPESDLAAESLGRILKAQVKARSRARQKKISEALNRIPIQHTPALLPPLKRLISGSDEKLTIRAVLLLGSFAEANTTLLYFSNIEAKAKTPQEVEWRKLAKRALKHMTPAQRGAALATARITIPSMISELRRLEAQPKTAGGLTARVALKGLRDFARTYGEGCEGQGGAAGPCGVIVLLKAALEAPPAEGADKAAAPMDDKDED